MMDKKRKQAKALALKYLDKDDPLGWFDPLYIQAKNDASIVPWADLAPNPNLLEWLVKNPVKIGEKALIVGCGLGDDAEELAQRGLRTTAFDISPAAIEWSQKRFPQSTVSYESADLLDAPSQWTAAFDFVVESYTLQALPPSLRANAVRCIASFVAPAGTLLVICRGRGPDDPEEELPWPLTKEELSFFENHGLINISFDDFYDNEDPPQRRFRATYLRHPVPS